MKTGVLLQTLLFALLFIGCNQKNDGKADADKSSKVWKEMDDFHTLMAEAFHPYMDSANLQPAKEKAPELLAGAKRWQESSVPEKVNNEETKTKLNKLVQLATQLDADVKSANDKATGETLFALHDLFHELQNDWYGAASEGGHHEHDHEHEHEHGD